MNPEVAACVEAVARACAAAGHEVAEGGPQTHQFEMPQRVIVMTGTAAWQVEDTSMLDPINRNAFEHAPRVTAADYYKAVTAVFIAQLYGVPLGPTQLVTIVVASVVAAFAGPGVPGSSLVTTLIVLNAIGLGPHAAAGIALVVGVDRPLDMCRSTVNTIGNLIGAALVARGEGVALVATDGPAGATA